MVGMVRVALTLTRFQGEAAHYYTHIPIRALLGTEPLPFPLRGSFVMLKLLEVVLHWWTMQELHPHYVCFEGSLTIYCRMVQNGVTNETRTRFFGFTGRGNTHIQ